jgi:integrase
MCWAAPPRGARPRERALSNDEIRLFWQACDVVGEPFGAIFKLLLLTGARLNEVAGMRRSELHANGVWQLPGSRTKNRRPYKVLLPATALAFIPAGQHDLVFTTTGTTPASGWSRAKRRLDAAMLAAARERARDASIAPWRLHDLRRTAVTGMAELGVRTDVIELCVNHVSGSRGGIAGVYNHSELLPERKAALERWSAHIAGLVSGGTNNIVALHPRQMGAA